MLKDSNTAYARFLAEHEDVTGPIGDLLEQANKLFRQIERADANIMQTPAGQVRAHYVQEVRAHLEAMIGGVIASTFNHAVMASQVAEEGKRKVVSALGIHVLNGLKGE